MSDGKVFKYDGKSLDVFWDGRLCIHVAECGRSDGPLFEGGRKPWCQPDLVDKQNAKEVCERCPSGALTYVDKEGGDAETPDGENSVTVQSRGPLFFRGELEVVQGEASKRMSRAALCRCGQSKNKPYCDNSHQAAGFSDQGAVGTAAQKPDEAGGPLKLSGAKNGPLLVSGNFFIKSGSGRVAFAGKKAALCRCGDSKNKPFCDGSHAKNGFSAE